MGDERGRATGEAEGAGRGALAWNKRLQGASATWGDCSMGDERGRATGEAEGAGRGALPSSKCSREPPATRSVLLNGRRAGLGQSPQPGSARGEPLARKQPSAGEREGGTPRKKTGANGAGCGRDKGSRAGR